MALYCATRPVYEALAQRRLATLDGVRLRERCQFTDYRSDDGGATVEGVAVRDEHGEQEELAADLVVAARFFERAAAIVDDAWLIAVGADFRFPRTTGPTLRGLGLSNR